MATFMQIVGANEVARVAPVLPKDSELVKHLRALNLNHTPEIKDTFGTVAGAGVGAYFVKKHRVLGAIAGASVGRNAPALLNAAERKDALINMAITAAGIAGSIMLPKHKVLGFVGGFVGANVAAHFAKLR